MEAAASCPAGVSSRVGVVISTHCASHNRSMGAGQVAEKISPGDQIFDRPVRVSRLLALLEPEPGQAAEPGSAALLESLAVVRSARLATDRELTIGGVTSKKYLQFLKQHSRELQKKQATADKWRDQPASWHWRCRCWISRSVRRPGG